MCATWKHQALGIIVLTVFTALVLLAKPMGAGQSDSSGQEADGVRVLKGAIDMHFHVDPPAPSGRGIQADIGQVRMARARGLRGLVLKNHYEPTGALAYHLRLEMPDFDLFGAFVMNLASGGINVAGVEYMATQIKGKPGRVVWFPANDTEAEIKASNRPDRPFVTVVRNGQLVPDAKEVISIIAKDSKLILATGHVAAPEALMVLAEGRRQGVQHMIATHAMDQPPKMTLDQMQQAIKLGAIVEFDYRNVLNEGGIQADAIRKLGPENCLIAEFWTKNQPREYGEPRAVGAWVSAMHTRGFTDHELDLMFKENPAKLLGLSAP